MTEARFIRRSRPPLRQDDALLPRLFVVSTAPGKRLSVNSTILTLRPELDTKLKKAVIAEGRKVTSYHRLPDERPVRLMERDNLVQMYETESCSGILCANVFLQRRVSACPLVRTLCWKSVRRDHRLDAPSNYVSVCSVCTWVRGELWRSCPRLPGRRFPTTHIKDSFCTLGLFQLNLKCILLIDYWDSIDTTYVLQIDTCWDLHRFHFLYFVYNYIHCIHLYFYLIFILFYYYFNYYFHFNYFHFLYYKHLNVICPALSCIYCKLVCCCCKWNSE